MPVPDAVTDLAGAVASTTSVSLTWSAVGAIIDPVGGSSTSSSDTATVTASATIDPTGGSSTSTSDVANVIASGIAYGPVVYTQAEIDAWQPSGNQYTRLLNSWGGNNSRTITNHGSAITTDTAREALRNDGIYAKCQAVLYAANGQTARRDKVIAVLDGVKNVTSWTGQSGEINLVAGWTITNLCQAARIVGYESAGFETFLRNLCRTIGAPDNVGTGQAVLDWVLGVNWLASLTDSRIQIASYLEDAALWADAKDFLDFWIKRCIYLTADGASIFPVNSGNWRGVKGGTPNASLTSQHTRGQVVAAPWLAERADLPGSQPFPNGWDGEAIRDLHHELYTLVAFVNAARTIRAVGDAVPQHAHDRIKAAATFLSSRTLYWIVNGSLKPDGFQGTFVYNGFPAGVGGANVFWAWGAVAKYLGAETPADVLTLCDRSEIRTSAPGGFDHLSAPLFAEGLA